MRKFGLLGYPLSHSFSARYFAKKFKEEGIHDATYELFEETDFLLFLATATKSDELVGFNITIPYKEAVLPFLNSISDEASYVGAVNTVKKEGRKLIGYNTDVIGFEKSLQPLLMSHHRRALVLGTGGAAKAVTYVLKQMNIPSLLVSRYTQRGHITYEQVNGGILGNYQIVINTTPVGMSPNIDDAPTIPYQHLSSEHLCYDLVYNPEETKFLQLAKEQGAITKNGLEMLHIQAEESWKIWNNSSE